MKAVICEGYGAPEVLKIQDLPKPIPKSDEVLIRIKATCVNSGDVRVRGLAVTGLMKFAMLMAIGFSKPRKPILGTVLSGIIEEVGSKVNEFSVGDNVMAITGFSFGTFAEYICINKNKSIIAMPSNANYAEAASIIFGGSTSYYFLKKARLDESPKKILIFGAAGSVGVAAIEIAKYYKADVVAVASSSGLELAKTLGARQALDYTKSEHKACTEKFDVVFDAVGKTKKTDFSNLLNPNGLYLTVGGWDVADETVVQLKFLKKLFEEGIMHAVIDKTFPLEKIVDAHRYVDTGRKKGNVVITI